MTDVETKREAAIEWMVEHVDKVGETVAERVAKNYIDEDTQTLVELVEGRVINSYLSKEIAYAPKNLDRNIAEAFQAVMTDPIAPLTDVDLVYFWSYGFDVQVEIDPDPSEIEDLRILYASEEGEAQHMAHNI